MRLYIKNMVCPRCIMAVKSELEKLGLKPLNISLGEVDIQENEIPEEIKENLDKALIAIGFERIDDRKSKLIEKIKNFIIQKIHHHSENEKNNWSDRIAEELHYEYNYLSNLFSSVEGITIEQFIIKQKIEKVKELMVYDELSLSEISHKMGYSSVAYLSSQFKKITGLTPSFFKNLGENKRRSLDNL